VAELADVTSRPHVSDAAAIAGTLRASPLPLRVVLTRPDLLPATSGFYAWWMNHGALSDVPHVPHPLDGDVGLIYVGISPSRATSRQTIRTRVLDNHIRGNVGGSTLRYVLAALLVEALDIRPRQQGRRLMLANGGEARVREWQRQNLGLTWCERDRPWEVEHDVIAALAPPLNSAGNSHHPFHARVREARAALRQLATAAGGASATPEDISS
jgi:hypothetical protein